MSEKSEKSVIQKLLAVNSKPTEETFPELPDALLWMRCVIAIIYGVWLSFSTLARQGAGLLMGVNLITFLPFIFCSTYLGANIDSYGSKILFSGTINAIAFLLLIWIYFYTLEHEEEEKAIIAALYAAAGSTTTESDTTTIGDPAVQPPTSDAEF